MPSKTYSEEFKRDAVASYENPPDSSIQAIATDLGVNRNTLHNWLNKYSTGTRANISRSSTPSGSAAALSEAERIRQLEKEVRQLREERDILRKAAKYFAEETSLVIRFQFVDDIKTSYSVKRLCEVLGLNRSSYCKWKKTATTRTHRQVDDALLGARIKIVFTDKDSCYGAKRIASELNDEPGSTDTSVNHKRVARIMKALKLFGYTKKRRVNTTQSNKKIPAFPDLVNRNFSAEKPGQVYVGDLTYLPIKDGSNMYLATVIDCFSRRLVGFAIADHMRTSLVQDALGMAKGRRDSLDGAVFHSVHGSVYTSQAFQETCIEFGVRQSMGAVGTSADNSLSESFNVTLKREVLKDSKVFASSLLCRREVFRWCTRYNTTRRHSWCGYLSPSVFEQRHSDTLRSAS